MADAHLLLIPGFFGFANVGQPRYFEHVRRELVRRAAERGLTLAVHEVGTHPTASLTRRAARLHAAIVGCAGADALPIHLLGHSTGAVDARMWMAHPGLEGAPALRARVRSIVSVTGAHRGTPSATFFASLSGHHVLRLLSAAAVWAIRGGALDTSVLRRLARALTRETPVLLLDQITSDLVEDLDGPHREDLGHFLSDVASDGSLLPQLAPVNMEVIDALLGMPAGVRCGSVVAAVPAQQAVKGTAHGRYRASLALFGELHRLAARAPDVAPIELRPDQARALAAVDPALLGEYANDGLVPLRSQLWGELVHAAIADHMDVLGHFADDTPGTTHRDWMYSGTSFGPAQFDALWRAVADFAFAG